MYVLGFFFFKDTATTEIYTYGHTLSLHDALPICLRQQGLSKPFLVPAIDDTFSGQTVERIAHRGRTRVHRARQLPRVKPSAWRIGAGHDAHLEVDIRSEEHTSELQSLMRISYAVFCLKKKKIKQTKHKTHK